MRQYGEVPPWLAASNTPAVKSTTGLGTGGGASVQTPDSGGFGTIVVTPGVGFNSSGSVTITFPNTPPTLWIAGEYEFGTVTQSTSSDNVTISWTGAVFKNPKKQYHISYEWASSF